MWRCGDFRVGVGLAWVLILAATANLASADRDLITPRMPPGPKASLFEVAPTRLEYLPVLHAEGSCEMTRPPEPLTTPLPLIGSTRSNLKLTVSFIIGTDGGVSSAFVLKSSGSSADRAALLAVRSWRYRPALCNGTPSEAEARVEFSTGRRSFDLE